MSSTAAAASVLRRLGGFRAEAAVRGRSVAERISAFRQAVRICPKCGALDLPEPAKPTLEREQDGSYTCSMCGTNFRNEDTDR